MIESLRQDKGLKLFEQSIPQGVQLSQSRICGRRSVFALQFENTVGMRMKLLVQCVNRLKTWTLATPGRCLGVQL